MFAAIKSWMEVNIRLNRIIFHIDISSAFLPWEAVYRIIYKGGNFPNYGLYEKCSAAFMDILREYSDIVEQYNIDEAFVDLTASCRLFGQPEDVARQIKDHIWERLGFTVNVGVSSNKLLAKMITRKKTGQGRGK